MIVIRRRDRRVLDAEILRPGEDTWLPILLIDGTPFPPGETSVWGFSRPRHS